MAIKYWSEDIIEVDLTDEPQFTDDLVSAGDELKNAPRHIILNMSEVTYLNSSSLAELIKLRKIVSEKGKKMKLCSVQDSVWGVMMTSGLDKMFKTAPDLPTAIASIQIGV